MIETHKDQIKTALAPYWPAATNRIAIHKNILVLLKERQKNKCFYCEVSIGSCYRIWPSPKMRYTKATIDHIVPVCKGGANTIDNLVMACDLCNKWKAGKRFKDDDTAKKFMKQETLKRIQLSPDLLKHYFSVINTI